MLFSKTHSFHSYYYFTLSYIYYSHLLTITKLLLGETFKWVHVRFYKRKFRPLKLVSILTNIINFNPKFVTFITTSTILINLFVELILSRTCCIYYYFYYLFISFHIESSLLIGVILSFFFLSFFFSTILCSCEGLH